MKKVIAPVLALVLVAACFAGCASSGKKIVGKWICTSAGGYENSSFVFNEDGTGSVDSGIVSSLGILGDLISSAAQIDITYGVDKDTLTVIYKPSVLGISAGEISKVYKTEFKGDALTLTDVADGTVLTFVKSETLETVVQQ